MNPAGAPLMDMAIGTGLGFLFGSLLPGYWIGRIFFGKDIRTEGSGNIGATNAFRVLGPAVGTLVLLLDVVKGMAAVWVSRQVGGIDYLAGLAAILGHTFSPFLKFRGGKGVATALGVFLSLALKPTLVALSTFIIVLVIGRRVSAASCLAAVALAISVPVAVKNMALVAVTEVVCLLVLVKHGSNLRRMIRGEEPPLF